MQKMAQFGEQGLQAAVAALDMNQITDWIAQSTLPPHVLKSAEQRLVDSDADAERAAQEQTLADEALKADTVGKLAPVLKLQQLAEGGQTDGTA